MSVNTSTMFPSSAWHSPWEEQEHLAGPETQSVQGSMEVVVEKVTQERGRPVARGEVQVTASQGAESTHSCWQSSGVGMSGVKLVMKEESQVVLAVRQEGKVVEAAAAWSRRRRRRGVMVGCRVTEYEGCQGAFIGGVYGM